DHRGRSKNKLLHGTPLFKLSIPATITAPPRQYCAILATSWENPTRDGRAIQLNGRLGPTRPLVDCRRGTLAGRRERCRIGGKPKASVRTEPIGRKRWQPKPTSMPPWQAMSGAPTRPAG